MTGCGFTAIRPSRPSTVRLLSATIAGSIPREQTRPTRSCYAKKRSGMCWAIKALRPSM